ncbi:hypothetical protein CC78DRAFT_583904 [Lojkania enalia]|uniref:Uncharacterized protein n=1 Tax=Lojkania enalia TaxID=147567 RepID=A0A9P4K4B1_9PLEO|nr:hypothetical protein CC78DRAFT_583904 [Didymosphaeria enalia]
MKTLSPMWFVGALSLSTLVSQIDANNGIMVELRIRMSDVVKPSLNERSLFEVRDASIIADGGFSSFLAERADNSTLSQIEEIVQKRQASNNNNNAGTCKKTQRCYYKTMVYNEKTQQCENCPSGQQANAAGDKCEKPKTDQERKEQGKCPDGQKLDPAVPGQDELTENPKCVDKDSKDCPEGQTMSTPKKDQPSKCAPDDEPDKKCDNEPDTELYKEIGPDGKMKSSCRSTKEKEEKKKNQIKEKQDVIRTKYANSENNDRERKRRIRARRGACLALGAMSFITPEDVGVITDDEMAGLQEPDFDGVDPIPGVDLEDYMITLSRPMTVTVEMETAGFGGAISRLIMAIFNAGKAISKAARTFQGAAKTGGGERFARLRNLKKDTPASKGAVEAARKSDVVKRIVKSDTFLDCVALGAITAAELGTQVNGKAKREARPAEGQRKIENISAGGYILSIDLDAEKVDQHPVDEFYADRAILVVADTSEDARDNGNEPRILWQTWSDNYHRSDRVGYQSCNSLRGNNDQNNAWTLVQVWGGCCNFYDGENCEADTGLFAMTNREHGDLQGKDNDAISSFWCTFDENCHGAPGLPPA